jgi:hypothetical protein
VDGSQICIIEETYTFFNINVMNYVFLYKSTRKIINIHQTTNTQAQRVKIQVTTINHLHYNGTKKNSHYVLIERVGGSGWI